MLKRSISKLSILNRISLNLYLNIDLKSDTSSILMKPYSARTYSNFQFDDYKDLPVTVLERFEWADDNNIEGGK